MLETTFLLLLDNISSFLWASRGLVINFIGVMCALYLAELMIVGKKSSSIKATFVIALIYTIIGEVAGLLLSPIPILVFFIQVVLLAILIKRYYEDNWLIIFSITLMLIFCLMLILALTRMVNYL